MLFVLICWVMAIFLGRYIVKFIQWVGWKKTWQRVLYSLNLLIPLIGLTMQGYVLNEVERVALIIMLSTAWYRTWKAFADEKENSMAKG